MSEPTREPSEPPKWPVLPTGAEPRPSLLKWHLGAFMFFLGGIFLIASLEGAKDFAKSKEPLEYVFSFFWNLFFNVLPNLLSLSAAAYGAMVMRRHWNWALPEHNRFSAVVLLTLAAMPMLVIASVLVVGTVLEWISGTPSRGGWVPGVLHLVCGFVVGSPWAYSQFKAWRDLLQKK